MEYKKSSDGKLIQISVMEQCFDMADLLMQIDMLLHQQSSLQSEIDKLRTLVAKGKELGIEAK